MAGARRNKNNRFHEQSITGGLVTSISRFDISPRGPPAAVEGSETSRKPVNVTSKGLKVGTPRCAREEIGSRNEREPLARALRETEARQRRSTGSPWRSRSREAPVTGTRLEKRLRRRLTLAQPRSRILDALLSARPLRTTLAVTLATGGRVKMNFGCAFVSLLFGARSLIAR